MRRKTAEVIAAQNPPPEERVKEVAGNADAKAHQHEEPEGAEEPVTKRDRALKTPTSDEVEPPKKRFCRRLGKNTYI